MRPTLTVVIDTEEEFDWAAPFDPRATSVANIACQGLAQRMFDRFGVVPTYVVDYPVACSAAARAVLRPMADSGRCEIGAHLHPWVNPPIGSTTDPRRSFPGNLPPEVERAKLAALTQAIADGFGRRPVLYKAGRYGIGPATYGILAALGYRADLSVVPYTDFTAAGGPDFSRRSPQPAIGAEGILALPLTAGFAGRLAGLGHHLHPLLRGPLAGAAARLGLLERLRLSPEGHRLDDMKRLTRALLAGGQKLFMLTYHSSSLLPGGSPYARNAAERDALLAAVDGYLSFFLGECGGRAETVGAVAATLLGG